jgi:hypothetical protein
MTALVENCSRCKAQEITFDVLSMVRVNDHYFEFFCKCRRCSTSTIFRAKIHDKYKHSFSSTGDVPKVPSLNSCIYAISYISLRDENSILCPDHAPQNLTEVFNEGASCYSIGCYNASVAMFRLCLDLDTKPLAQQHSITGMLGHRLVKLFKQNLLPIELEELSHCIKENGNDGAHDGTITKDEALDVMEFTISYLETRHTMPERIRLRREAREARKSE